MARELPVYEHVVRVDLIDPRWPDPVFSTLVTVRADEPLSVGEAAALIGDQVAGFVRMFKDSPDGRFRDSDLGVLVTIVAMYRIQ